MEIGIWHISLQEALLRSDGNGAGLFKSRQNQRGDLKSPPPFRSIRSMGLRFFNPYADIRVTQNQLPHWQQPGATYFITFRLADALPASLLKTWREERDLWRTFHPEPWTTEVEDEYHRRFSSQTERWLDAGYGSCLLRDPEIRRIVEGSLMHFNGTRHDHLGWAIMPNHVHVLAALHPDHPLEQVVSSWKRHSAREINRALGKSGQVWQHEYFDRMIRSAEHFEKVADYIRRNPEKAGLRSSEFTLFER